MSEQIQGGLFDEKPTELSTADIHGQSQTPEARYARNYRKNPENKKRINENRRKNRQMKKDQESRLSLVLESAASPITSKPQTVENAHDNSNAPSISDLWSVASWELNDSSQSYCQEGQKPVVMRRPLNVLPEKLNNEKSEQQADLLLELRDSFRGIHNELKLIREEIKPTAPALPKINDTEQQVTTTSEKVANKKTILKRFVEKLPMLGISLLILTFLGFNIYFLVSEQQSLYTSMSYSAGMALLIAILSETSLILLSTMASWTANLEWKIGLTTGMVAMVVVMVGVLDSSAKNRSNTAARQTKEAQNIEKQLTTLRALEAPILARIEKLDPQDYRTEISRLSAQLTTPPEGYSYKIDQLSTKLATISTAEADTSKLVWQRRAALFINLLLSAFLGFLWSKNQESVLTKIGKHIGGYWQRTCEV